ncbi:MAG TPA: zinc ABC transporter substrate-binding protein [Candidatus Gracilibacteria bacterium]|nr:zinc ABC transporter substrate-binding protein [Candidatus Gracilibacteria bacterium]
MIICCLLILSACTSITTEGRAQNGRLKITATIFPYYDLVKTVVQDRADLRLVVPLGIEPHEYEPSAREIADIYNSDLFIYNGLGMEPWADRIKSDLENKGVKVLKMSDHAIAMQNDPHLWLNISYMENFTSTIGKTLQQLDASEADKKIFAKNAENFISELEAMLYAFNRLSSCNKKEFITGHAAFTYLSSEFGLTNYSVNGPTTEGEPSAGRIAEIITLMKQKNFGTIFIDNLSSPKFAQVIADQVGGKVAVLYTLENVTKDELERGETYLTLMSKNLDSLKKELDCPAGNNIN